jgi:hypothetical protein
VIFVIEENGAKVVVNVLLLAVLVRQLSKRFCSGSFGSTTIRGRSAGSAFFDDLRRDVFTTASRVRSGSLTPWPSRASSEFSPHLHQAAALVIFERDLEDIMAHRW